VKPNGNYQASKHRPHGFESLEPRYTLDGSALSLPTQLPPATSSTVPSLTAASTPGFALPLMGMSVYAVPIGPVPVSAQPSFASATSPTTSAPTTILAPISLAYIQRLNGAALPIGPARPATLPSQTLPAPPQALPTQPPAAPASPLYAEGVLPANQTPANLPTTQQSMPVITNPPGVPTFTLLPSRPLR